MSDNNSLNEKYQKFEPEEAVQITAEEDSKKQKKDKKEKKVKEPKAPKEKKVKEPKAPKEKKPKEPKEKKAKEPKAPKEKKVKEPKAPKEKKRTLKKHKSEDVSLPEINENIEMGGQGAPEAEISAPQAEDPTVSVQNSNNTEEITAPVKDGRYREEIIFESNSVQNKKAKKQKAPKEKKAKEPKAPKAPKEKKIKEPKEPKEPKAKKVKEPKEKKPHEPLEKKDIATIAVSVIALILVLCLGFFAYFNSRSDLKKIEIVSKISFLGKIFPEYKANSDGNGLNEGENKLSSIQIARDGIFVNLMQTDFQRIFYGINTDYTVQYYQYSDKRIVPVKYTDTIDLKVDMGSGILNVKMNYIKNGDYVSGISVFTSNNNDGENYFYDLVVFKLTVLPSRYSRDGHALLLASTDRSALEGNDVLWSESFDVNLNDGSMTRFLSVVNRTIDSRGAGVADFCMLNKAGYTAVTQKIPFISSREYPVGSGLQDIFVKNGNKEELLASDVYGKYCTVDATKTVYLRRTATGFDVIHNTNGEERIARSFYGYMDSSYMINDKYILSKTDGHLYNIVSGKDYSLVGYAMNATSFIVSSDNRYVVMMGTVKNAVDYQIHVFDLQTGEYAKFPDKNYAIHGTLCFIDDSTVLYTAVEPNQGYEYVILDISKAFEQAK